MKAHRNVVLTVAALACIFLSTAHAQRAIAKDARFTLPWKAMWANTILPPGDYTLSVIELSGVPRLDYTVTVAGAGINKTILVVRRPGPEVGKRSRFVTAGSGEVRIIRALHLPNADLVLTFPESQAEWELLAKAPDTLQSVPILVAAK